MVSPARAAETSFLPFIPKDIHWLEKGVSTLLPQSDRGLALRTPLERIRRPSHSTKDYRITTLVSGSIAAREMALAESRRTVVG